MRQQSTLLQWIEQSEAAQVLTAARFERPAQPALRKPVNRVFAEWRERVRSWLSQIVPVWPQLQPQPVLVRRTARRMPRRADNDDYRCCW